MTRMPGLGWRKWQVVHGGQVQDVCHFDGINGAPLVVIRVGGVQAGGSVSPGCARIDSS